MQSLHYGTKQVAMMRLPALDDLDDEARQALDDYDAFLSRRGGALGEAASRRVAQRLQAWAADDLACPVLEHALSPFMEQLSGLKVLRSGGSEREIDAFAAWEGRRVDLRGPETFRAELLAMSCRVGGEGAVRSTPVGVEADFAGNILMYPPADEVEGRLGELQAFLAQTAQRAPSFAALVAMNGVFNCHPFADGNGRAGRLLFNRVAHAGRTGFYLPLYELSALSRGGFTISLRQAQYRGEWTPLCRFLTAAAGVVEGLLDEGA